MGMKSLESTFVYNHMNKSNALTKNIGALLTIGETLTKKQLAEPFMIIMKNFKFPLKHRVMEAFDNGDIVLKFGTPNTKLPTCLPFILTKSDNKVIAAVAVDIYGSRNPETGDIKIDPKKLYCMMESAYMAILSYLNFYQIGSHSAIISNGSAIYSGMFTRVLNKKYALNLDKTKSHKVIMLSSKFFMINHLGMKDSDTLFNYAIKNCNNGNLISLEETNSLVKASAFEDFKSFILALQKPELGLNFKDLTVRNYLEAFINMYDGSNLLSLESFPYFMYNVVSVIDGAYINNQYVLEDIVGNYGSKMYIDISNLEK